MLVKARDKDILNLLDESYDRPVLIYFWAPWVVGSTDFMPEVNDLALKLRGVAKFVSVDTEENLSIVRDYKVKTIPTVIILKDEEVTHTLTGLINQEHIKRAIGKHI